MSGAFLLVLGLPEIMLRSEIEETGMVQRAPIRQSS